MFPETRGDGDCTPVLQERTAGAAGLGGKWRRGRDSNPRWVAPYRISSAAPSATRRPLRGRELLRPIVSESKGDGGEGGIRTRGAFAHRFSRAAPSTTRTPLHPEHSKRARQGGRQGASAVPGGRCRQGIGAKFRRLLGQDPGDDPQPSGSVAAVSQLDDRATGTLDGIGQRIHQPVRVGLE